jgi:hypothetical protein
MNSILHDYANGFLGNLQPPCLSLYQPTGRHHPGNQQDPIRFRNLVREMEQTLRKTYPAQNPQGILKPFKELAENREFWNHTLDGLVVFAAPDRFRVYTLPRPVSELTIVADSFHIKPLIRFLQNADRYQVLGISLEKVCLFEGNRDALDEVELDPAVPRTPNEAPRGEAKEFHVAAKVSSPGTPGTHFGQGSKSDIVNNAASRFFRAVDRAVLEHHSRPARLPLILAALPENQSHYRGLSRNPFLVPDEVTVYPDAVSVDDLRERVWAAMEPHFRTRIDGLVEMFGAARSKELGDDNLENVAASAVAARVGTLLTEADRYIPGRIDPESGAIVLDDSGADDVLDDIAEMVLKNGGQVVILPAERMPTKTGVAAMYR